MGKRWSCKVTETRILAEVRDRVSQLKAQGVTPHLAVVLVGDNPASQVYVRNKVRTCGEMGIDSGMHHLPKAASHAEVLALVKQLNEDPAVHGILVQLPLPPQVDEEEILETIEPAKDVDGFHAVNVGYLSQGRPGLFPCTPMGVIELLRDAGVELKGKHAAIVGRSNIVGKPMAQLLLAEHCTVTIIHSRAKDPKTLCRQADIVVAAVGKPGLVDGSWLKEGALVVDVGINQIDDAELAEKLLADAPKKMAKFKEKGHVLYGDVHYTSALEVAAKVTPVPGGVGPLTIAHLMKNCLVAAERSA